jgi:hypothetical protein
MAIDGCVNLPNLDPVALCATPDILIRPVSVGGVRCGEKLMVLSDISAEQVS